MLTFSRLAGVMALSSFDLFGAGGAGVLGAAAAPSVLRFCPLSKPPFCFRTSGTYPASPFFAQVCTSSIVLDTAASF